jgi:hypothetical protein
MAQGNINWDAQADTNYAPGLVEKLQFGTAAPQPTNLSLGRGRAFRDGMINPDKTGPRWDLLRAVGRRNLGVSFNPYLTTARTAQQWLAKQQANDTKLGLKTHSNWVVANEDLDDNVNTPDDVIINDRTGNPQVVSGYSLNTGKGRRAAIMYSQYPN